MTKAPGRIVRMPAAASTPQSIPLAPCVRVMIAAMGFASTVVSVRLSSSSTHENMKQKNAATPIPLAMSGMKIFTKNRGKE